MRCPLCHHDKLDRIRRGRVRCNSCKVPFCGSCGQKHSLSLTCRQYQDSIERARQRALEEERRLRDLAAARAAAGMRFVRCPNCCMVTEKMSGCNYMTCRCGQFFCFLCGCPIDSGKHFSHFNSAPYGDFCIGIKDASALVSKNTWHPHKQIHLDLNIIQIWGRGDI